MIKQVKNTRSLWVLLLLLLPFLGNAAPLVEVDQPTVALSLPPYIDILEDSRADLTIHDVMSPRYAFQFAPASMTELFFGYTPSAYWLRFTVENQRDEDMAFVLEASPADIDYLDLYEMDPHTDEMHAHKQTGSGRAYRSRDYDYPLYLFDLKIESHAARTYYMRVASNKTTNVQLSLHTQHHYLKVAGVRDWWQGFSLGGLLLVALIYLGVYCVFRFKGFLWYGLFLLSVMLLQSSWNGYWLQFYDGGDLLLDRQIISPVYFAILFSCLFAQSLLSTRKRSRLQHHILDFLIAVCLVGGVVTWFVDSYMNSMLASVVALCSAVCIFGFTMYANMEGHQMARHFLLARTLTTGMILVSIFNVHGYLPQGRFTAWGITSIVLLESVVMMVSMLCCCWQTLKGKQLAAFDAPDNVSQRSLINLADICHELRTPISGVLGMTDLLIDGNLTDQQSNQVKTIKKSGQALLDVTNKIADLSSIEMGSVELNHSPFELTSLIETCVENCRSRAEFNGIELIYHVDNQVAGFVRGDHEKLQQIVINLLHLALRHLEQGEVILTVVPGTDKQTVFSIRSGHNTLLDRNILTDNRPLGSSDQLNLTIAEQYLKLMAGVLSVQSYIDGGMNVNFSVQLEQQNAATLPQHDDNMILQGLRMLVVDDNATCCSVIEQQASQWGMTVQSANGGKEALAIMRARTTVDELFDIVLVDYDMPSMTGLELAQHIREDHNINSEKLLIVMLTGVSKAPGKNTAESTNIQRVLYKPLSGKSLKQALQSAMAQHMADQGASKAG